MADYKVISVRVREDVWISFKNHVLSKYGQLYGYLGEELTKAMDYYLSHAINAHTQENEHILSKPNKRHIKLLTWLAKNSEYEITHTDIEGFIVENFGVDKRTKRKYLNEFLIKLGFIKQKKALYGKNVIYVVNFERIYNYLKRFLKGEELRKLGIIPEVRAESSEVVSEEKTGRGEVRAFAVERYEAGDSLDEVTEKVSDFGLILTKKAVRNMIRDVRREEYV